MDYPGERLVLKLWESLAEKGIGGLLRPWQERRVGRAQADVKAIEIVVLAKAKAEANRITSETRLEHNLSTQQLPNAPSTEDFKKIYSGQDFDPDLISEIVAKKDQSQSIRREVNVANAVLIAEDALAQSESDPNDDPVEEDWLHRWEEYAGQVSSEELQELWGRVLAGEIEKPGSNSLRLLEFLKTISRPDAQLIESLAPFVINGVIARDQEDHLTKNGLTFGKLLELQELGILSSVDSIGVAVEYASTDPMKFLRVFVFGAKAVVVEHEDLNKKLTLPAYTLTGLGQQVLSLGHFDPDYEYFLMVAKKMAGMGFSVRIGNWLAIDSSQGQLANAVKVEA